MCEVREGFKAEFLTFARELRREGRRSPSRLLSAQQLSVMQAGLAICLNGQSVNGTTQISRQLDSPHLVPNHLEAGDSIAERVEGRVVPSRY